MKTHEFAKHLEQLARFLRKLPNTELDPKHSPNLQDLLPDFTSIIRTESKKLDPLPKEVKDKLWKMSPAEIERYLSSEEDNFSVYALSDLANDLGLTVSKRQSKNALVNMITRHLEAIKMHSIMREAKSNDE